jgi:hypothetical protein
VQDKVTYMVIQSSPSVVQPRRVYRRKYQQEKAEIWSATRHEILNIRLTVWCILRMFEGPHRNSFCAPHCIMYAAINARGIPTNAGRWLTRKSAMKRMANGQKKMKRLRNHLVSFTPGMGNCRAFPFLSNPASMRARRHWRVVFISCAVTSGVLPSLFLANRSAPYSSSFCIDPWLPFTSAQCSAVKPWSSVAYTLAPHLKNRSTQDG